MKRLFSVKSKTKGVLSKKWTDDNQFDNKEEAKAMRDLLGGVKAGFFISRGIDHRNYKGRL